MFEFSLRTSPPLGPPSASETDWALFLTHPRRTVRSRRRYRELSVSTTSLRGGLAGTTDPSERARILFELACQETQLAELSPLAWGDQAPGAVGRMRSEQHRATAQVFSQLACAEVDLPDPPQVRSLTPTTRATSGRRTVSLVGQRPHGLHQEE